MARESSSMIDALKERNKDLYEKLMSAGIGTDDLQAMINMAADMGVKSSVKKPLLAKKKTAKEVKSDKKLKKDLLNVKWNDLLDAAAREAYSKQVDDLINRNKDVRYTSIIKADPDNPGEYIIQHTPREVVSDKQLRDLNYNKYLLTKRIPDSLEKIEKKQNMLRKNNEEQMQRLQDFVTQNAESNGEYGNLTVRFIASPKNIKDKTMIIEYQDERPTDAMYTDELGNEYNVHIPNRQVAKVPFGATIQYAQDLPKSILGKDNVKYETRFDNPNAINGNTSDENARALSENKSKQLMDGINTGDFTAFYNMPDDERYHLGSLFWTEPTGEYRQRFMKELEEKALKGKDALALPGRPKTVFDDSEEAKNLKEELFRNTPLSQLKISDAFRHGYVDMDDANREAYFKDIGDMTFSEYLDKIYKNPEYRLPENIFRPSNEPSASQVNNPNYADLVKFSNIAEIHPDLANILYQASGKNTFLGRILDTYKKVKPIKVDESGNVVNDTQNDSKNYQETDDSKKIYTADNNVNKDNIRKTIYDFYANNPASLYNDTKSRYDTAEENFRRAKAYREGYADYSAENAAAFKKAYDNYKNRATRQDVLDARITDIKRLLAKYNPTDEESFKNTEFGTREAAVRALETAENERKGLGVYSGDDPKVKSSLENAIKNNRKDIVSKIQQNYDAKTQLKNLERIAFKHDNGKLVLNSLGEPVLNDAFNNKPIEVLPGGVVRVMQQKFSDTVPEDGKQITNKPKLSVTLFKNQKLNRAKEVRDMIRTAQAEAHQLQDFELNPRQMSPEEKEKNDRIIKAVRTGNFSDAGDIWTPGSDVGKTNEQVKEEMKQRKQKKELKAKRRTTSNILPQDVDDDIADIFNEAQGYSGFTKQDKSYLNDLDD